MFDIIREYFLLFIIYSTIGWVMEIIYTSIRSKGKITNRGFLIGPYCPIYGVGCLLILILLSGFKNNPILVFLLAILISSTLEYFTSYIMEKLFKARWWDYSGRKLNINGRICMETMIPFGIIACVIIYLVNPVIVNAINNCPNYLLNIITILYSVLLIVDLSISFSVVNNFKKTIKKVALDDITDDINKYIKDFFLQKSVFTRRLIKAFPRIQTKRKLTNVNDNSK